MNQGSEKKVSDELILAEIAVEETRKLRFALKQSLMLTHGGLTLHDAAKRLHTQVESKEVNNKNITHQSTVKALENNIQTISESLGFLLTLYICECGEQYQQVDRN